MDSTSDLYENPFIHTHPLGVVGVLRIYGKFTIQYFSVQ